jgi:hypothetical protein
VTRQTQVLCQFRTDIAHGHGGSIGDALYMEGFTLSLSYRLCRRVKTDGIFEVALVRCTAPAYFPLRAPSFPIEATAFNEATLPRPA